MFLGHIIFFIILFFDVLIPEKKMKWPIKLMDPVVKEETEDMVMCPLAEQRPHCMFLPLPSETYHLDSEQGN